MAPKRILNPDKFTFWEHKCTVKDYGTYEVVYCSLFQKYSFQGNRRKSYLEYYLDDVKMTDNLSLCFSGSDLSQGLPPNILAMSV